MIQHLLTGRKALFLFVLFSFTFTTVKETNAQSEAGAALDPVILRVLVALHVLEARAPALLAESSLQPELIPPEVRRRIERRARLEIENATAAKYVQVLVVDLFLLREMLQNARISFNVGNLLENGQMITARRSWRAFGLSVLSGAFVTYGTSAVSQSMGEKIERKEAELLALMEFEKQLNAQIEKETSFYGAIFGFHADEAAVLRSALREFWARESVARQAGEVQVDVIALMLETPIHSQHARGRTLLSRDQADAARAMAAVLDSLSSATTQSKAELLEELLAVVQSVDVERAGEVLPEFKVLSGDLRRELRLAGERQKKN